MSNVLDGWNFDMSAAPRDNTLLLLLMEYDWDEGVFGNGPDKEMTPPISRTLGCNNFDNDGKDDWKYVGWDWDNDGFEEGMGGTPRAWRHIAPEVRAEDLINAGHSVPWAEARLFSDDEDISGWGLERSRLNAEQAKRLQKAGAE